MTTVEILTPLVLVLAFMYVPGAALLHFLGIRGFMKWVVSPLWSAGFLTFAAITLAIVDKPWSRLNVVILLGFGLAISYIVGRLILGKERQRHPTSTNDLVARLSPSAHWLLIGLAGLSALLTWIPSVATTPFDNPPQGWDTTYHLSAIWSILDSGDASPLSAFSGMYGPGEVSLVYPAVFHQFVSLSVTKPTIIYGIKFIQLIICFQWYLGIAALAKQALPRVQNAPFFAVVLAQTVPGFPAYLLFFTPNWPNALGVSLIPAVVAFVIYTFRQFRIDWETYRMLSRESISRIVCSIGMIAGLAATYPSAYFSLIIILFCGISVLVLRRLFGQKTWIQRLPWLASLLVVFALLFVIPMTSDTLSGLFSRSNDIDFSMPIFKAWQMASLNPAAGGSLAFRAMGIVTFLLLVVGVVIAFRTSHLHWVLASWVGLGLILLATQFPIPLITSFTGIWYHGQYRTIPPLVPFAVLLMTLGLIGIYRGLTSRSKSLVFAPIKQVEETVIPSKLTAAIVVIILALGAALSWPIRQAHGELLYAPEEDVPTFMADEEELDLMKRISSIVEEGEVVYGDPMIGTALLPAYADVDVAYKQFAFEAINQRSEDAYFIARRFQQINWNSDVCRILNEYNIRYFYRDTSEMDSGTDVEDILLLEPEPLLFREPFRLEMTLLDSSPDAEFYRIDQCNE